MAIELFCLIWNQCAGDRLFPHNRGWNHAEISDIQDTDIHTH